MRSFRRVSAAFLIAAIACGARAEDRKRYVEVTPREHAAQETFLYVGGIYILTGLGYYLTSKEKIQKNASLDNYLNNLGRITIFDTDSPNANWLVHVYTGSQAYNFYRARSYTKTDAFLLTTLQSALFEMTLEIIQEPASLEDLINTPVLGAALGRGFELASIPLLNSDFWPAHILGYVFNLPALFGLYEGVVTVEPAVGPGTQALLLRVRI